ncbi:hypothetical protein TL16_g06991 [Triparma laevis f. inornata]|uniref:Uncharacterized protein n=1 Tax=Triparma laevis f. inornata TaxID=1714386 RepID=A0A9W7AVA9_9STRA|nr:hypothetical protein TL16_g06991 [Triparma laevis f. inornata]
MMFVLSPLLATAFPSISIQTSGAATCSLTPAHASLLSKNLTKHLQDSGYAVESAFASWFLPFDSNGPDNPDGTYMEYMFKQSDLPSNFCDVNFETCFGDIPSSTYTQSTLIGPNDALVFLGCSPPPSSYFASDLIVSSRFTKTIDESIPAPDPDDIQMGRDFWFPGVPFNDALNQLKIENFEWLSPLTMIQSFNSKTTSDVQKAIKTVSEIDFATGIQQLNSTYVNMYSTRATEDFLDALPDSFRPLVRWSMPDAPHDGDLVQNYFSQSWPVLVVRGEHETPDKPKNLFLTTVTGRVTGKGEQHLNSTVEEGEKRGRTSEERSDEDVEIEQAWNYLPGEMADYVTALQDQDYGGDYLGTQDAVYGNPADDDYNNPAELKINAIAVLTGVMHTQFGTTTYNNIGVMDTEVVYSQWINNKVLKKCPSTINKDIFQVFFIHAGATKDGVNCDGSDTIPSECCFVMDPPEDLYPSDSTYPMLLGERSYLNPDTKTGPDFDEIIGVTLTLHH